MNLVKRFLAACFTFPNNESTIGGVDEAGGTFKDTVPLAAGEAVEEEVEEEEEEEEEDEDEDEDEEELDVATEEESDAAAI